jgi:hypothetical protein
MVLASECGGMSEGQIQAAIAREMRWLMGYRVPPEMSVGLTDDGAMPVELVMGPAVFSSHDAAARCLRIEATSEVMRELEHSMRRYGWYSSAERVGPARFHDIAIYEIGYPATLPDPGWRVVNPFRKKS